MHEYQPLQDLPNNHTGLVLGEWLQKVMLQISQTKILHSDKERIFILEPSERSDKAVLILPLVSIELIIWVCHDRFTLSWENLTMASNSLE
jgi:hypothetical protein